MTHSFSSFYWYIFPSAPDSVGSHKLYDQMLRGLFLQSELFTCPFHCIWGTKQTDTCVMKIPICSHPAHSAAEALLPKREGWKEDGIHLATVRPWTRQAVWDRVWKSGLAPRRTLCFPLSFHPTMCCDSRCALWSGGGQWRRGALSFSPPPCRVINIHRLQFSIEGSGAVWSEAHYTWMQLT